MWGKQNKKPALILQKLNEYKNKKQQDTKTNQKGQNTKKCKSKREERNQNIQNWRYEEQQTRKRRTDGVAGNITKQTDEEFRENKSDKTELRFTEMLLVLT